MPVLARIGNIKIHVFASDHNPPHFHVATPEHEALVAIADFSLLRGVLRRADLEVALGWARENRRLLEDEWNRLNG